MADNETLRAWDEYRRELVLGKRQAIDKYDAAVLIVAGAFLAFSVNFLHPETTSTKLSLFIGWVFLACAVMSSLASSLVSWRSFDYVAREASRVCRELREGTCSQMEIDYSKGTRTTFVLNFATSLFLVAGIVAVIIAAYP